MCDCWESEVSSSFSSSLKGLSIKFLSALFLIHHLKSQSINFFNLSPSAVLGGAIKYLSSSPPTAVPLVELILCAAFPGYWILSRKFTALHVLFLIREFTTQAGLNSQEWSWWGAAKEGVMERRQRDLQVDGVLSWKRRFCILFHSFLVLLSSCQSAWSISISFMSLAFQFISEHSDSFLMHKFSGSGTPKIPESIWEN